LLLGVVAVSAAVLNFAALRDLALLCGFTSGLAPLLPVTIDAGAAVGSLVWLGGWARPRARTCARWVAVTMLGMSVIGNGLSHGLVAYAQRPTWWLVVLVSAVAPAVLGAVVHLAVLATEPAPADQPQVMSGEDSADPGTDSAAAPAESVVGRSHDRYDNSPAPPPPAGGLTGDDSPAGGPGRAAELIAVGAGRRRLAGNSVSASTLPASCCTISGRRPTADGRRPTADGHRQVRRTTRTAQSDPDHRRHRMP